MLAEKSNFTITRMVRLLEVSRSGFYAWLNRAPSKRAVRMERIEQKVTWFHGESVEMSGAPKILADLRDDGETISQKTVAKAMRKLGRAGVGHKRLNPPQRAKATSRSSGAPSSTVPRTRIRRRRSW